MEGGGKSFQHRNLTTLHIYFYDRFFNSMIFNQPVKEDGFHLVYFFVDGVMPLVAAVSISNCCVVFGQRTGIFKKRNDTFLIPGSSMDGFDISKRHCIFL